jgi:predicted SprT family Zn-dependent metalloprotease
VLAVNRVDFRVTATPSATRLLPRAATPNAKVRNLAGLLLRGHGLHDWTFDFNRRKCAMGFCCYTRRTIELSTYFVEQNPMEAIVDTLLHEIAHALVGPNHGHDRVWKVKCREIGAIPSRLGTATMPTGKWQAGCRSCGRRYNRHRKPKRMRGWYCPHCGVELGRLVWKNLAIVALPAPTLFEM